MDGSYESFDQASYNQAGVEPVDAPHARGASQTIWSLALIAVMLAATVATQTPLWAAL